MKRLLILTIFLLLISLVSASSFQTTVELKISSLTGVSELDNSDGTSLLITIINSTGVVVSRNAAAGVYKAGSIIPITGEKFNLDYATDYTYNLSTDYGDFLYYFSTPAEPAVGGGAVIKSIQQVTIQAPGGQITINEVNPDKTMLICSFSLLSPSNPQSTYFTVELTNSTTLSASSFSNVIGKIMVVEYESGVKSVQRGILTLPRYQDTPAEYVINPVNVNKSLVFQCGVRVYSSFPDQRTVTLHLKDSTHIEANRGDYQGSSNSYLSWEVIEFE